MIKTVYSIPRYLLILFFLYYYVGTTAFVHTHQVNEYTITHSHPFFPGTHHSHSSSEYETVGWLNMLIADTVPLFSLFFALAFIAIILQATGLLTPYRKSNRPSLRAPPFNMYPLLS